MDKIINTAKELLSDLDKKDLTDWEKFAVLDTARVFANIQLHTEIDAMPPPASTGAKTTEC